MTSLFGIIFIYTENIFGRFSEVYYRRIMFTDAGIIIENKKTVQQHTAKTKNNKLQRFPFVGFTTS